MRPMRALAAVLPGFAVPAVRAAAVTPDLRTRLARSGYRAAYALLVSWSWLFRPHTRGVKCLIARGDELLLVRHSYGPGEWDIPGGFCRRGEDFAAAARREAAEELGVNGAAWTRLGELERRTNGRHEKIQGFRAELAGEQPRVRSAEVLDVRWFDRARLPRPRAEIVDAVLALEAGGGRGDGGLSPRTRG